jgi:aldehyde dehydrogenase (NAD+)
VQAATRSGAFVRNDHLVQATGPELPFGGVGPSGMGRSHGRAGFEAFSNPRAQFRQSARRELPLRYPPYDGKLAWVKRLMG